MLDTKAFKLRVKQLDEDGKFEGYASVFGNVDQDGEVVVPGAFAKTITDNAGTFPLLWQHDRHEPIGLLTVGEDAHGLAVKGAINLETQRGREAYALLKQGAIRGMSIGYQVLKDAWSGHVRNLKEIRLRESSLVTFPANELAVVTAVKAEQMLHEAQQFASRHEGLTLDDDAREYVKEAVTALTALLGTEPADATQGKGAADKTDEPGAKAATLREWIKENFYKESGA